MILSIFYGATNESGFTALPGGYRCCVTGDYRSMGGKGGFWSSTEHDSYYAWTRELHCVGSGVYRLDNSKHDGFSVRCIKD